MMKLNLSENHQSIKFINIQDEQICEITNLGWNRTTDERHGNHCADDHQSINQSIKFIHIQSVQLCEITNLGWNRTMNERHAVNVSDDHQSINQNDEIQ